MILSEYHGLEAQLLTPICNDAARARKVGKRFNELQPIIQAHARSPRSARTWRRARNGRRGRGVAAELARLRSRRRSRGAPADLLAPRDPHDSDDMPEIVRRCGEEAALFVGELARMYQRRGEERLQHGDPRSV